MRRDPEGDDFAAAMMGILIACIVTILALVCYIAWRILT
jgi:hypothetical protein